MTRSNPVVSRKTFLAVARGFLLEEREEAYFRIDWAKTMTDPHFLRHVQDVVSFSYGFNLVLQRRNSVQNLTRTGRQCIIFSTKCS